MAAWVDPRMSTKRAVDGGPAGWMGAAQDAMVGGPPPIQSDISVCASGVPAASDRRRRSEIDATIYVALYNLH